jgi:electron-transferring-flavoprotein dehydrogenase
MDPRALNELIPDWKEKGAPLNAPVSEDRFLFLTESGSTRTPNWMLPGASRTTATTSSASATSAAGSQKRPRRSASRFFPGSPRPKCCIARTEASGRRDRRHGNQPQGREDRQLPARNRSAREVHVLRRRLPRAPRGGRLEAKFGLRKTPDPQVSGIGLKELWDVKPEKHQLGLVVHTAGMAARSDTYGGSFPLSPREQPGSSSDSSSGLAYTESLPDPYEEFQRFKTHPAIRGFFEGGKRVGYGARAIAAGGMQSLPELVFPGGCLIGDDAGFLNASRIKGTHAAIKSGMLAAEAAHAAISAGRASDRLDAYPEAFRGSWLFDELWRARNFKPWMSKGLYLGSLMVGIDQIVFGGKAPWTLRHAHADNETLQEKSKATPIQYPKPDGVLTFDRLTNVSFSNTNHGEDQPVHLTLKDPKVPVAVNLELYDAPEQRYCPAGVYEIVRDEAGPRLQINAQNCVHCKTCDIKDPTQNIVWVTPEGGGGPNYPNM